jgi:hypothetical protein
MVQNFSNGGLGVVVEQRQRDGGDGLVAFTAPR